MIEFNHGLTMLLIRLKSFGRRIRTKLEELLADHVPYLKHRKFTNLGLYGQSMTDAEAAYLEENVAASPNDLDSRTKLLGKYFLDQFTDGSARQLRLNHIEWFITNHPGHTVAGEPLTGIDQDLDESDYPRFKSLWLDQTQKPNVTKAILANAANFFLFNENELAEHCLLEALKLAPGDRSIPQKLAQLYSLWDGHEQQALDYFSPLCNTSDSENLLFDLSHVPEIAFSAKQFDQARLASEKLIKLAEKYRKSSLYGGAINKAHTVLGRLALIDGDIEKAKKYLALSIINIASPTTCSFGPNLELASELVKAGETACVLEYLDKFELLCGVTNIRAFEVRFEALNGVQDRSFFLRYDKKFDAAFLEHKVQALASRDYAARQKHLRSAIQDARSTIKIWSARFDSTEETVNSEQDIEDGFKIELYEDHIRKLNALRTI